MGVRVELSRVNTQTLKALLHKAWQRRAPKSLLREHHC